MWLCLFMLQWSPLPPLDHCQWESPSNPRCCLAWHCLTLPPHICMSCGVSAKVYSDVMGTDGSILPADSDDFHAQVQFCVCACVCVWVLTEPVLQVMTPEADWLAPPPLHLGAHSEDSTWQLQVYEAADPPPLFSMLYFTWSSILSPLFLLFLN